MNKYDFKSNGRMEYTLLVNRQAYRDLKDLEETIKECNNIEGD